MSDAILFDLDDTLLDRTASLLPFMRGVYQRYQLDHVDYAAYHARFLELDQRGYAEKPVLFGALIAEYGIPAAVESLLDEFQREAWTSCVLLPHAVEVLSALRERGFKLGVITNGKDWSQMRKLRVAGLLPLLDAVLISGNEGVKKPHPLIFARAAARLSAEPRDCVFVGDHARNDIYGAGAAGMKTVWYPGDQAWPHELEIAPHHTISSLADLLALDL